MISNDYDWVLGTDDKYHRSDSWDKTLDCRESKILGKHKLYEDIEKHEMCPICLKSVEDVCKEFCFDYIWCEHVLSEKSPRSCNQWNKINEELKSYG